MKLKIATPVLTSIRAVSPAKITDTLDVISILMALRAGSPKTTPKDVEHLASAGLAVLGAGFALIADPSAHVFTPDAPVSEIDIELPEQMLVFRHKGEALMHAAGVFMHNKTGDAGLTNDEYLMLLYVGVSVIDLILKAKPATEEQSGGEQSSEEQSFIA